MPTNPIGGGQIGRSIPRLEAREKVTGRAEYTHLMRLPGMLYGKIFRSTVPHGRIKSVDTSAAKKIPGVFRVITAEDVVKVIPDPYYGPAFHDQPILAMDKVRFVGEPVAVVLAADPHVAEAAVQAITAEYEELEPIYDEVEAMTSASHVHDELKPAGSFADLKHLKGIKDTNLALQAKTRRGDVDKAFAEAAHVFEHEFRTQKCLHVPFEPFCSIADYKESGLTIYSGAQGPSFVRSEIARLLGLGGKQGAHQSAVSRRRLRRQALHQARSAGDGVLDDRAPAGQDRADHGGAVLSDHQASGDDPHQERHRQVGPHHGAQMRGVLERRRVCRYRPARDA